MTNMKKIIALLALGLIAQARADDIQIQMTGNIYANTCVIDSASRNLTVDLGQADSAHPTKFANTGSAKGLALELADRQDKILIAPQAAFNVAINPSDHTATFPLSARYYATSMPVSAGTFSSVIQVTFTYQ